MNRPTARRVRLRGADLAIVLVIILGAAGSAGFAAPRSVDGRAPSLQPNGSSDPVLQVSPSGWTTHAGNTTSLLATWSEPSAGCIESPLWFHWAVTNGSEDGYVSDASLARATLTTDVGRSGSLTIVARSALELSCGSSDQVVDGVGSASGLVVAPLELGTPTVSPDPIIAGGEANLSFDLYNGEPPYHIHINWGDATQSSFNDSAAGTFRLVHRFSAGIFRPMVTVADASGALRDAAPAASLVSSAGVALGIDPVDSEADAGLPVSFSAVLLHSELPSRTFVQCGNLAVGGNWSEAGSSAIDSFSCDFDGPTTGDVQLEVVPAGDTQPPLLAQLAEPVVPDLRLEASAPVGTAEVGVPVSATVWLIGGVPPYQLDWAANHSATSASEVDAVAGRFSIPLIPPGPGPIAFLVRVTDADGDSASATLSLPDVAARLSPTVSGERTLTTAGALVNITGIPEGGIPPYLWWIVPDPVDLNSTLPNGSVGPNASFGWISTYRVHGPLTAWVIVLDSVGLSTSVELVIPLVPSLVVDDSVGEVANASGRFVALQTAIDGGDPPFNVTLDSSAGEHWNLTAPGDGSFAWLLPTNDSGVVGFQIAVEDALGAVWASNASVVFPNANNSTSVPPPPSTPPPAPDSPGSSGSSGAGSDLAVYGGVGVVLLGIGAGLALMRWRRRSSARAPQRPSPDPIAVVRGIIEPADGAERSTVELLAEEAGVPAADARATIDRLIADGSLRAETGEDGEEVLAWSHPS